MGSLNMVILQGNLGRDPEVKKLESGDSVATFSLATNEYWTDKEGKKQERTEWHRIVAWRRLAEIVGQFCKKGKSVTVVGRLRTRSWEDEGIKRYVTEIEATNVQLGNGGGDRPENQPGYVPPGEAVEPPDDIPF